MAHHTLLQSSGYYYGNDPEVGENSLRSERGLRPNAAPEQVKGPPPRALRHRSAQPQGPLYRVMSMLVMVAGFGVVALVLHEFFHFIALRALGGDGYITFDMKLGLTHFTLPPSHLWMVQLSGGLLTGGFLLLAFWYWAWSSRSVHFRNVEVAAFAWALGNITYAPAELITSSPSLGAMAFGVGFGVAGILYFTRLTNWLASGEQYSHTSGHLPGNERPLESFEKFTLNSVESIR